MAVLERVGVLALCGALVATAPARGEQLNACAEFYNPAQREQGAEDVFINVETLNGKTFEYETACFLVPRAVLNRKVRYGYSDRSPPVTTLAFEPVDLFGYVKDKQTVVVGSEERLVESDKLSCLADPAANSIYIVSRTVTTPVTVGTISAYAKEISSDMPGYLRYFDTVGDYYAADNHAESQVSFWCRRVPEMSRDLCLIVGDYDEMTAVITYQKGEMKNVEPDKALQCAHTIADLFRVTKPSDAN